MLHTRSSGAELDAQRASVVVVTSLTRKPGTCVLAVHIHIHTHTCRDVLRIAYVVNTELEWEGAQAEFQASVLGRG